MEQANFQHPHPAFLVGSARSIMQGRLAAWALRAKDRNDRYVFLEHMREHRISELSVKQLEMRRIRQCRGGLRHVLAGPEGRYAEAQKRRTAEEQDEEDWAFPREEPELPEADDASTDE